jgi:hypothetical protein
MNPFMDQRNLPLFKPTIIENSKHVWKKASNFALLILQVLSISKMTKLNATSTSSEK